jgi:hypothetical protein
LTIDASILLPTGISDEDLIFPLAAAPSITPYGKQRQNEKKAVRN